MLTRIEDQAPPAEAHIHDERRHFPWLSDRLLYWSVFFVPIILGFAVRLRGVDRPLNEIMGFRQTQTAFTVREFMRSGISLLHSPLPVRGPPWDVPLEFPLFQALAAIIGHAGLDAGAASRLTGLIFFEATCALLGILALQWFSRSTALLTVILFQLPPFAAQWAWSSLIEFLATAAAIAAVITMNVWVRRRRPVLIGLAIALQLVAFLVKPTTAAPWLFAYAVPAVQALRQTKSFRERQSVLGWIALPPLTGILGAALWTHHADAIKAENPYTVFITSGRLPSWNFGTLDERIDVNNWIAIFNRLPALAGGTALLLGFAVMMLVFWRASLPALALVLVPMAAVGAFFNLYVVHDYYLCAIYPAVILILAAAITGMARLLPDRNTSLAVVVATTLFLLALAWTSPQGQQYQANVAARQPFPVLSRDIAAHTERNDGIILVGCDWDPTWLYYADRRGLMLRADEVAHVLPARLIPDTLSYLGYCGAPDGMKFLPPSVTAVQVAPHVFRLVRS